MDPFERFLQQRGKDLRRIARATRGEQEYADVAQEAWLMAGPLSTRCGMAPDFLDAGFQDLLLSHLYQALVRYTELNVRHAVRLDHGTGDDGEEGGQHWLMNRLASDGGHDPLSLLIAGQEEPAQSGDEEQHPSLAGAWIVLLRGCEGHMRAAAEHLLISVSHAYRCCAKARHLASRQNAIPLTPPRTAAQLGPWRRYRIMRTPRQLEFDFGGPLLPLP
jgi:hypothetical protein